MNKNNLIDLERRDENEDPLTNMLRAGAQQLIHQAVEAELQSLLDQQARTSLHVEIDFASYMGLPPKRPYRD